MAGIGMAFASPCLPPAPEAHTARTNKYSRPDLKGGDSDHPYLFRHDLPYTSADTTEEACFKRNCIIYTCRRGSSVDLDRHEDLQYAVHPYNKQIQEFCELERKSLFEIEAPYNNALALTSLLNYAFKMRHTIPKIHRYPARAEGFGALLSICATCPPRSVGSNTKEDLREIYGGTAKDNAIQEDSDRLLENCTSARPHAATLVFGGEKYYFVYFSLLFCPLYLCTNNGKLFYSPAENDRAGYNKRGPATAHDFEKQIRQKLCADEFEVHPASVHAQPYILFNNAHTRLGRIYADRTEKTTVLVVARCEDVSPSSMAKILIVDQEVVDKWRGLIVAEPHNLCNDKPGTAARTASLALRTHRQTPIRRACIVKTFRHDCGHTKRYPERCQLFTHHLHNLKKRGFGSCRYFSDYAVHTSLVTKHDLLISGHKSARIVHCEEFPLIDLRGARMLRVTRLGRRRSILLQHTCHSPAKICSATGCLGFKTVLAKARGGPSA